MTQGTVSFREVPSMTASWPYKRHGAVDALPRATSIDSGWEVNLNSFYKPGEVNEEMIPWLVHSIDWMQVRQSSVFYGLFRAVCDWILAFIGLVVLSPLFLGIAILIKLTSSGRIFYVQTRIGQNCRAFKMLKFRTMYEGAEKGIPFESNCMQGGMFKVQNDHRIFPFGRLLRRWSLDELPQLCNVLRGEMSLIGPRPLEPEHACAVPRECYARFALRPGLTGLWQATARDTRNGFAKFQMDTSYVHRRSFTLDLYLLRKTVVTVISGIGAD